MGRNARPASAICCCLLLLLALPAGGQERGIDSDEQLERALEEFVRQKMAEDPGLCPGWPPEMTPEALLTRWHALLEEFADRNHLSRDRVLAAWQAALADEWEWQEEDEPHPEKLLAAMRAEQLVEAAAAGDIERVGALLEAGTPADHPYPRSDTALLAAAGGGHESVVALLLERGANPNRTGDRGRSPLSAAYEAGSRRSRAGSSTPGRGSRRPRPPGGARRCSAGRSPTGAASGSSCCAPTARPSEATRRTGCSPRRSTRGSRTVSRGCGSCSTSEPIPTTGRRVASGR